MVLDLFSKTSIPNKLPKDMQKAVNKLKKSKSKMGCLRGAYKVMTSKNHGELLKTFTRFYELFYYDINVLWAKKGYMHCTNIGYVLRILLIKSGWFNDKDISLKWTFNRISPHQYLAVKVGNKMIDVDAWAHVYGIKLGNHAGIINYFRNK